MRLDTRTYITYKDPAMKLKLAFKDRLHFFHAYYQRNPKAWLSAAVSLLLIPVAAFMFYFQFLDSRPSDGKKSVILDFPPGISLNRISSDLSKHHIISNSFLFTVHARLEGSDSKIKAGTYRFTDGMSPREILRKLVAGDVYTYRFSVPEGYSIYQIAELLDKRGIFKKDAFLARCFDVSLLAELGIEGQSTEGYLFPCTYEIPPNMNETALIRTMVNKFRSVYTNSYAKQAANQGMSLHKLLTLASLIEKEAVAPRERPLIASVFLNRLKRRMPLQSDPTAVYGLRAFAGKVSRQDIMRKTPYNTYMISGLPPGPIGNPGEGAVEAVLAPAKTGYLYFVAKNDGTHQFSASLAEHNRAVELFLKTPHTTPSSGRPLSR